MHIFMVILVSLLCLFVIINIVAVQSNTKKICSNRYNINNLSSKTKVSYLKNKRRVEILSNQLENLPVNKAKKAAELIVEAKKLIDSIGDK